MNGLFADHDMNIEAQALATRGQHGYLLTDISGHQAAEVSAAIAAMPQTVRLRIL